MQVFLLSADFESDRMMSHKHGLAAMYSFKMVAFKVKFWASFEMNFFRIAGTLEGETLVSGKAECSLAIGENKKSTKLFGVTFSFNNL